MNYGMEMNFEVIVRQIDNGVLISEKTIHELEITKPESIIDIGFRHSEQIDIISSIQDSYIPLQCKLLLESTDYCPKCQGKIRKNGSHIALFHASLSDHKLKAQGYSCSCGWQSKPTIHGKFGSNIHPDLVKTQATLGASMPYKEAEVTIAEFNCRVRSVNNHVKIAEATNKIGSILSSVKLSEIINQNNEASQLYLHVDGGHIKDKKKKKRSFEAMVATIFKHQSYRKISDQRRVVDDKHIAASSLKDNGDVMNQLTLKAAQKEGLTASTEITAFCDGAANCWNIVDSLANHCKSVTKILDWFHIRQAYDRAIISLPEYREELRSSKYKVWHGKSNEGITKLQALVQIMESTEYAEAKVEKVVSITTYLANNKDKLVNYMTRKTNKLPYTSNVAEATVESQINIRFKRKQKMQWNRENAHNVLQLRTTIASNEWAKYQSCIDGNLINKVA
jgi:hypothetical protein